ncbi:unnamed protein product [Triticum turgidum subsp. durum]|uniref:Protein kinase domain-containing protein n=1 Tax=Triticum turgidum subsp. durum TaxID=4567 RepID=A0A9R0RRJ5_TRITD|nr:unnamed protein product [Triticum turgidum subsp. durum]
MMGCFTGLRSKKKKSPLVASKKHGDARDTSLRLPEPEAHVPSLQSAPPSFRNRAKICQSANKVSYSRARVLSAPSSLILVDQDGLPYAEFDDQDDPRGKGGAIKAHRFSNPLPLPLPSPEGSSLRNFGSFKAINASGPLEVSGPLPLPPKRSDGLKNFSYDEISTACQWFSSDQCVSETQTLTSYKASFRDDFVEPKKMDAIVARLLPSNQSFKEFKAQVNTLASLQHPNLCKLIGYHARDESNERMLVYERLHHGSLDRLLFGRPEGRLMDWSTRLKVALGAAKGLAFLHDEGPFQAMYDDFSTSNIQIEKDFTAKLSGYGCVGFNSEEERSKASVTATNLSEETLEKGVLTPKSNVWSFGVVLLELITGRKNLDVRSTKEERNIVKWGRPFLTDDSRLSIRKAYDEGRRGVSSKRPGHKGPLPVSSSSTVRRTEESDAKIHESQRHCSSASCHDLLAVASFAQPAPGVTEIIDVCAASPKELLFHHHPGLPQGKLGQEIAPQHHAETWRRGFLIVHIVSDFLLFALIYLLFWLA